MPLLTETELEVRRQALYKDMGALQDMEAEISRMLDEASEPDPDVPGTDRDRQRRLLRRQQAELDEFRSMVQRSQLQLASEYHFDKQEFLDRLSELLQTSINLQEGSFLSVDGLHRSLLEMAARLKAFGTRGDAANPRTAIQAEANRPLPIRLPAGWGPELNHEEIGLPIGVPSVLAAYTGTYKTRTALNLARETASTGPVVFFSFEMTPGQLYCNLLMQHLYIETGKANTPAQILYRVRNNDQALLAMLDEISTNIHIVETNGYTVHEIIQAYDRIANDLQQAPALVILDYLQMINMPQLYDDRRRQVDDAMSALTARIKQIQSAWLNLCQINRTAYQLAQGRAPDLDGMKESSSIEADAGFVITLGRIPKKTHSEDSAPRFEPDRIEIHLPKNRFGPAGIRSQVQIEPVTGTIGTVKQTEFKIGV